MLNKILAYVIGFAMFAGLLCAILAASRMAVVRWDGLFPYVIVVGLLFYYPVVSAILPSGRVARARK